MIKVMCWNVLHAALVLRLGRIIQRWPPQRNASVGLEMCAVLTMVHIFGPTFHSMTEATEVNDLHVQKLVRDVAHSS